MKLSSNNVLVLVLLLVVGYMLWYKKGKDTRVVVQDNGTGDTVPNEISYRGGIVPPHSQRGYTNLRIAT